MCGCSREGSTEWFACTLLRCSIQRLKEAKRETSLRLGLDFLRDNLGAADDAPATPTDLKTAIMAKLEQMEAAMKDRLVHIEKRFESVPPPEDSTEIDGLRNRLDYALGELELRGGDVVVRPWWKWWAVWWPRCHPLTNLVEPALVGARRNGAPLPPRWRGDSGQATTPRSPHPCPACKRSCLSPP
jgi:hypothetical protein